MANSSDPQGREPDPNLPDQPDQPRERPRGPSAAPPPYFPSPKIIILIVVVLVVILLFARPEYVSRSEITYSFFLEQVRQGNVESVEITETEILGKFKKGKEPLPPEAQGKDAKGAEKLNTDFRAIRPTVPAENLLDLLDEKSVEMNFRKPTDNSGLVSIYMMLSLLVLVGFGVVMFIIYRRARDQFSGAGFLGNFSKSPARRYEADKQRVTFKDVAGLEGVKKELEEVVEFLKNPAKFQRLGGRIPKGTLLMGPPGTGKTLLAKAVAGEAGVPFYSINGSEFIQMFVGVGASRVRDLFRTAIENAPAIVFIDEIDAVGRVRGAGFGGGHDEREQTLNQILSEMDGFAPNESVIVIAATNRPDVLDPALLRPGRFDRHITVDRPSLKGRKGLFKVHTRNVPVAEDVDFDRLAAGTIGLTGADIRNLVNEAALWATRQGKEAVEMDDFEYARDKVLMGPKRDELLTGEDKRMTAYHESGHALLAWLVPGADRVHKVSVIPRGRALGVTQLLPEEDRLHVSEEQLYAKLIMALGGRAAEKLIFDQYSTGAEDDLKRATQLARRMVTHWGMSERLGPVAYRQGEEHPFLGKEITEERQFSEHTAQIIDEEVARILHESHDKACELLTAERDKLETLTNALIKEETLDEHEIEELIGPPANRRQAETLPETESEQEQKPKQQEESAEGDRDTPEQAEVDSAEEKERGGDDNGEATEGDSSEVRADQHASGGD